MVSDKEMLERIAKLSSAIEQRKRGGYSGRGRGTPVVGNSYYQPYRPVNRSLNNTTATATAPAPISQHRTLTNINKSNGAPLSQHRTLTNNTSIKVGSPVTQHRTLTNTNNNSIINKLSSTNAPVVSHHRTLNNNVTPTTTPATTHHRTLNNTVTPTTAPVTTHHRTLNNNVTLTTTPATTATTTAATASQHRTLNNTMSHHRTLNNTTPAVVTNSFPTKTAPTSNGMTTSRNRTLVLNHKGPHKVVKSMENGKGKVSIDGVNFIVKGKKLIRQDLLDKSAPIQSTAPKVLVRRSIKRHKAATVPQPLSKISKLSLANKFSKNNLVYYPQSKGYIRTGRSNKSLVLKQPTKTKYCGFFTRYGQCPKADVGRCLFRHDRNRRAICMSFLRNKCKKSAEVCRLSHSLDNPHIIPHCAHFQKGNCTNPTCPYAHVGVNPDAPVCRAFAMEGYCPKGLECRQKHVHLCPEFAETSKCSNINCRLPHVAKKTTNSNTSGIVGLGTWVSTSYFHEQKAAQEERKKAVAASRVWSRPQKEQQIDREQEEEQGFVRLFDDSDDDEGWSQYEREDTDDNIQSLRFNEEEEDEEEELEEEENEENEEGEKEGEEENSEMGDDEELEQDKKAEQNHQSDEEGEFYDAEEDVSEDKDVIVLSDDDSDMEEVYVEISDDEISDEDSP